MGTFESVAPTERLRKFLKNGRRSLTRGGHGCAIRLSLPLEESATMEPVFETNLPGIELLARGKVRDVYDLGANLLIVSTDRLSAFDAVLPTPIPDKGRVLN